MEARNLLNIVKFECKQKYFINKLQNSNVKEFYHTLDIILCKPSSSPLPTYTEQTNKIANDFLECFSSKVENIQKGLINTPLDSCFSNFSGISRLSMFRPVTELEILKIINDSPSKSCELDDLPTEILKTCLNVLITPLSNAINKSLMSGIVPSSFKKAIVRPLIKKENLDRNELSNYRPVSNLTFISKILEKVVLNQLLDHLIVNDLQEEFQSAYRKNHSTETAMIKIMNDFLRNSDERNLTMLTLLDASAAFDCVNHEILVKRLEVTYGVTDIALPWFKSCLSDRKLMVTVG